MPINHPLQLVPAIKKMVLRCGGYNKDVGMEFLPSLNIITGPGIVLGESMILRSILRTIFPSSFYPYPLSAEHYFNTGCVTLEFMYRSVAINISTLNRLSGKPADSDHYGRYMLSQLHSYINNAPGNMALLIEEETTCDMSESAYRLAVEWISSAPFQIICVIGERFSLSDFPHARVFNCADNSDNDIHIEILQQGKNKHPDYALNADSPSSDCDMIISSRRHANY